MTFCLISMPGCLIGVKQKNDIIYSGFAKAPDEAKGAMRIATNDKIRITIVGRTDFETKKDLGGMYVIRGADLKAFVRNTRELNELKTKPGR